MASIRGWFKVESADGLILIDFISLQEAVQLWREGQQNGPCSTRIYCWKNNENKLNSVISSAMLHF